jgi:hypothetical protein
MLVPGENVGIVVESRIFFLVLAPNLLSKASTYISEHNFLITKFKNRSKFLIIPSKPNTNMGVSLPKGAKSGEASQSISN